MNSNTTTKRRYTPEEKQAVIDFITQRKSENKRGAQKEAAAHFGISTVTISSWMKSMKTKRGRKPGSKNTTSPKQQPLIAAEPGDLRRLAAVLEEIAELEAQTAKLETLKAEADTLRAKLTSKAS